jgi:hypothetical protein
MIKQIIIIVFIRFSTCKQFIEEILQSVGKLQISDVSTVIIINIIISQFTEPKDLLKLTDEYMKNGYKTLKAVINEPSSSDHMLGVAKLRLSIELLASKLVESIMAPTDVNEDTQYLFTEAERRLTSASTINDEQSGSGPMWYLLRYIVRKYGICTLLKLADDDNYRWIVPKHLNKDVTYFDFVSIYNPKYQTIRSAVSRAANENTEELKKELNDLKLNDMVMFVLAILERVHSSYLMPDVPSKMLTTKAIDGFDNIMKECKFLTKDKEVIEAVIELLHNKPCQNFPPMIACKDEPLQSTMLRMVVVHSVLTVLINQHKEIIKLLATLILSPESLEDSLLPAMPLHDPSITKVAENFYACVNGHQYTFDMLGSHCTKCGNIVTDDNASQPSNSPNCLDFGYTAVEDDFIFGYLSCAPYSIIRCIIHSCLLWSTCNGKNVQSLLKDGFPYDPTYFLNEIEKDLIQLSKAIGHSTEEACLIMHLVLKEIVQKGHNIQGVFHTSSFIKLDKLKSLDDRKQWEMQFYQSYIEPVVKDTELSLQQMFKELSPKDYNDIFGAVYINPLSSDHFLWHVHPELNKVQFQLFCLDQQLAQTNPVLYMYLTDNCDLQATRCIPEILKFQKMTQEIVLKSYEKEDIQNLTMEEFSKKSENRSVYESSFKRFQEAWKLCRHKLANYNRLHEFKQEYLRLSIDETTPVKYLIPMTSGPGVITTALVDHLIVTHNNFIALCRKFVEESLDKKWFWKAPQVHLMATEPNHFVTSDKFDDLLASHSVYTCSSGIVKICYDFVGIEKDIVQKFVLGKPLITHCLEIPQVTWHKLIYDTKLLAAVDRNVKQSQLHFQAKSDILREVKVISEMTSLCDTIETVMRYLRSKKEDPKKKLKLFVENDLQKKLRCEKVGDYCFLEHVVSLWKFLNVERAKIKVRNKENPFTDIREEFTQELNSEIKLETEISKMPNLDYLVEVMYEFIQTYIRFCSLDYKDQCLKDSLNEYVHQTKSEPIVNMQFFPSDITLSQVVCTWERIVLHRTSLEQ